jgi:hypothetical protein
VSDVSFKVGYMTMFIIGLFVGMAAFALIASVVIFNKLQLEVAAMHRMMQVMALKVNKIEKTSQATMDAAETFVDAIRSSAEQMMVMRPPRGQMPSEGFDDLRKSFEDGIRRFEENEMNESDEEDSEGEGEEPWKKK